MGAAEVHREIERKLEVGDEWVLPALPTEVGTVRAEAPLLLTAAYYDTDDLRLARHHITLRRRTGGHDDGWHVKLPAGGEHERDEVQLPLLTAGDPPLALVWLVFAYTRGAPLAPVATLVNHRRPWLVIDALGAPLAEITDDHVTVERGGLAAHAFREVEVKAPLYRTDGNFETMVKGRSAAGAAPITFASKAVRALGPAAKRAPDAGDPASNEMARLVLALQSADLAVRRELPGAVERLGAALAAVRELLRRTGATGLWRESGGVSDVLAGSGGVHGNAELLALLREPRYVALLDALVHTAADQGTTEG